MASNHFMFQRLSVACSFTHPSFPSFAWLSNSVVACTTSTYQNKGPNTMHYAFHEKYIIDWGSLISNEISF
jgi:hypothetical protein